MPHLCQARNENKLPCRWGNGACLELLESTDSLATIHSHRYWHVAGIKWRDLDGQLLQQNVGLDLQSNPVLSASTHIHTFPNITTQYSYLNSLHIHCIRYTSVHVQFQYTRTVYMYMFTVHVQCTEVSWMILDKRMISVITNNIHTQWPPNFPKVPPSSSKNRQGTEIVKLHGCGV